MSPSNSNYSMIDEDLRNNLSEDHLNHTKINRLPRRGEGGGGFLEVKEKLPCTLQYTMGLAIFVG